MTEKRFEFFRHRVMGFGGRRHLWDEQQAESDGHGQMSVSKKQHEHPVGVQPQHHGEPAEKSRDDPSSAAGAKGPLSPLGLLSPTPTHPPPQDVQLLEHPHTPPPCQVSTAPSATTFP